MIDGLTGMTDKEKEAMKNELPKEIEFLCPDTKSLIVEGGILKDTHSF